MKPQSTASDRLLAKEYKNDHTLHVALIMRDGVSKPDALICAYAEGKAGLNSRLNPAGVAK